MPEELWAEVGDIVQETVIKTIPPKKEMQKRQNGFLSPHWLLPGDGPQFLVLGPLHRTPHSMAPSFPQSQQESPA